MIHAIEITGLVIVGAALTNAIIMLVFNTMRRSRNAASDTLRLSVFRQQAHVHLEAARIDRARKAGSWPGVRKFVVAEKVEEAKNIFSFYLKPHDRQPLPPFLPGQYLTFKLRIPEVPQPVVRCYSLSDSPKKIDHYRITVKHLRARGDAPEGQASSYLAQHVNEGDLLDVMAPSGNFVLDSDHQKPAVLIAGGVGLTPVLSMLLTIVAQESRRETWLFYGVRHRGEHAMATTLKELASARANIHLVVCYSEPTPTCRLNEDYDHEGFVTPELLHTTLPSNNFDFYICGPPAMMDSLTTGLRDWGVPKQNVHFEAFGPASAQPSAQKNGDTEHKITFARSDTTCTWKPGQGSLLDIADNNAVVLDSGCRAGSCGSCITAVREGDIEYTIEPGIPVADGSCLACIAQPKSNVVLDA